MMILKMILASIETKTVINQVFIKLFQNSIIMAVNCMKVYSYDAWMMAASLSFASQTTDPL